LFAVTIVSPMGETKNQRLFDRTRQRLPCVIRDGEAHHQGFVTDLSPTGLFLQTRAKLSGAPQLIIDIDWNGENITVMGNVARVRTSNRSATAINAGGLGFQIQSAPEAYYQLVMELQSKPE
jgi:hypothetical protein